MLLDLANHLGTSALSSLWSAAAQASPDDLGTRPLPASAFDDLHERGFAVVADWLPAKSTAALLEEALELEGEARTAGVGSSTSTRRVDPAIRRTRSLWLHPPPVTGKGRLRTRLALSRAVEGLREQLSSRSRAVALSGRLTELSLLYYPTGGYYERHLDVKPRREEEEARPRREVSLVIFLDHAWQAEWGGALQLYPDERRGRAGHPEERPGGSGHPEARAGQPEERSGQLDERRGRAGQPEERAAVSVTPSGGTLVLMASDRIEHEVMPTARPRHAIVGWLRSSAGSRREAAARPMAAVRARGVRARGSARGSTEGEVLADPRASARRGAPRMGLASDASPGPRAGPRAAAAPTVQVGGHDAHGLPTVWRATHASCDGRPVQRAVWRVDTAAFLEGDAAPNLDVATGGSAVSRPVLPDNFHIVSSVPDVSEVRPRLTPLEYESWCANVVERMIELLPPDNVCILYQTPGRYSAEGGAWLDKGFLCQLGARAAGAACVWQKVVLPSPDAVGRRQGGTRAGFINLLCLSKRHRVPQGHVAVDVIADRGHMSYSHAMGEAACALAVEYCMQLAAADAEPTIVDLFCGQGSVLAVANALGLPAVGMEISLKRCATAAAHVAKEWPPSDAPPAESPAV